MALILLFMEPVFIAQNETEDTLIKLIIEFRQHACCLDAEEIQHWFDLLFAIVRVAEAKVAQAMKSGGHDPVDRKRDLQKEKEANIASMINGTEVLLKSSVV